MELNRNALKTVALAAVGVAAFATGTADAAITTTASTLVTAISFSGLDAWIDGAATLVVGVSFVAAIVAIAKRGLGMAR